MVEQLKAKISFTELKMIHQQSISMIYAPKASNLN